jgi:Na+:H+ antiporter, NhaA family
VPRLVVRPLQQFLRLEVSGGVVLLAATVAALLWANAAGATYDDFWSTGFTLRAGDHVLAEDLRHVVNDGLMAIFFFVVGLEVKRELVVGELSTRRAALLPLFAAVSGMVLPALVFLAVMGGDAGSNGWGIPMATDVAFALSALAVLGRRVPTALVAFLLGVAVIDDIGAILVVAFYYSDGIAAGWLAAAGGGLALIVLAQRIGIRSLGVYLVLGLAVWLAVYESGVHATIAGVALGLLTPVRPLRDPAVVSAEATSPLARWEGALHPWSSFVVIPIFALANAGVVFDGASLDAATETRVALAVALGLVIGKTVGITAGVALATRLRLSALPPGVGWAQMVGVGTVAGIGFTVSLFISDLSYADTGVLAAAKMGVLAGSVVAAAAGIAILLAAHRRAQRGRRLSR